MVENPGMETHVHPFEVYSAKTKKSKNLYLHTSPEFMMKELLSTEGENLDKIFTITYAFRDEPNSFQHRCQFLLLEWYRKNAHYTSLMEDTEKLILFCRDHFENKNIKTKLSKNFSLTKKTMQELILETINVDILNFLDTKDLKNLITKDFKDVPLPEIPLEWDDYFFLLYLNKVEPHIQNIEALLLYEFPAPLSALSTLKKEDPRVCERFEVYINGIELCNAFNEETSLETLKKRFSYQNQQKEKQYNYTLPEPKQFFNVMKNYPKSSGNALGVERLLYSLIEIENPFWN